MTNLLIRLFVKDYDNLTSPAVHLQYGRLAGWVGIACNLLLATAKLVAGFLSGSLAILADAVNNFSDAASSVITLIGFKLSAKPADAEHPFGHARFEYIAGLMVAVMVMVIGLEMGRSGIDKIMNPVPVDFGRLTLLILAASVLVKVWMAGFNRSVGRRIGSMALQATFADSRNDVIATSAVLVAALVARYTGLNLDGWMSVAVAAFILVSGVGLVKDTLDPLLGTAPDPVLVRQISEKIHAYPGVLGTHDLILHDYGPGRRFASAHVEMASTQDVLASHETIDTMERDFAREFGINLIIHYDPVDISGSAAAKARCQLEDYLKTLDTRLTIHDFRLVDGAHHVNYIFDVVVPPDFALSESELALQIEKNLRHQNRAVHVHLKLDDSYAPIPD